MKFFPLTTTQIPKRLSPFTREISFSIALLGIVAFYPTIAHASFISFITSLTSTPASASVSPVTTTQTSQNMPILTPAANFNPHPILADDLVPISGDSLTAEVGPSGTAADIDQATSTQISTYVVRADDNLSKIAKIFGVSVNTILWANNLSSHSVVKEGDTLVILPMSGIRYTVKKGDTLQSIIKAYKADSSEVLQYNDITIDSQLSIGQNILIPDAELGTPQTPVSILKKKASKLGWGAPGSNPAHDTNGPYYPGYYMRPIDGGYESQGIHGYNAVDLAAPLGTAIHASADGIVIISKMGGWNGGYGNYVVISHPNGTQTLYSHAVKNLVSVGQRVTQGQTIALLGQTGEATGPHVHFEIRGARNPF